MLPEDKSRLLVSSSGQYKLANRIVSISTDFVKANYIGNSKLEYSTLLLKSDRKAYIKVSSRNNLFFTIRLLQVMTVLIRKTIDVLPKLKAYRYLKRDWWRIPSEFSERPVP